MSDSKQIKHTANSLNEMVDRICARNGWTRDETLRPTSTARAQVKVTMPERKGMDLQRQIDIKNEYCKMIIAIGLDYDGYDKAEDLKKLVDELLAYAQKAITCDDKSIMYIDGNDNKLNILNEVID